MDEYENRWGIGFSTYSEMEIFELDGKEYDIRVELREGYKFSFVAGTKVVTPNGLVNIEDIKVGDKVYARDNKTGAIEEKPVLETLRHKYNEDLYKIYTSNNYVECTKNHLFYVKGREWVRADELKPGDVLINNNNVEEKITNVERIKNNETIQVYNLVVEDDHDYFVGLDGILAHNDCVAPGSQVLVDLEGNTKSIEELKVGDTVVSYNNETGENELRKITETYIHKDATDIVTIKFKDGTELVQNMYHPLFTKEGWKSLTRHEGYEYLENDDIVKTEEGWKEIESINIDLSSNPRDLYTFDVEGLDNFYANGTLIHDMKY